MIFRGIRVDLIEVNKEISPEHLQKGMAWNKPKTKLMLQFEEETGHNTTWANKITGKFEYWLFENNLKTSNFTNKRLSTEEYRKNKSEKQKEVWSNQILEFFLHFLQEHTYFSKKLLLETYIHKINSVVDEFGYEREFKVLIKHFEGHKVISKYSHTNYKINKDKLREYI